MLIYPPKVTTVNCHDLSGSSLISCWGILAFIKAADTRQNASFAIKLPKNYRKFAYEDKQTAAQMEEETEYDSDYDYDEEFWEEADDI